MLIMPELAVALRRELEEALQNHAEEVLTLSTWAKARSTRAETYVQAFKKALVLPMPLVLWQKGVWAVATATRDEIGGELTTAADCVTEGQLWLFDSVTIPPTVKKRFALPGNARPVARILLPISDHNNDTYGSAMGYLFQTVGPDRRSGTPFLRLLPDLYPGEFIADPHINFIAALRYANQHKKEILAPGKGKVFIVGDY
ncbi:hypothetical protein [Armatimonas sp.]|uniref:hypothetical protein n=1 Tax=Armatimonas sp. TaxID=1872638 RepID=UPI00286A8D02|nr:hypothetical protein [Armatimonas sp.]